MDQKTDKSIKDFISTVASQNPNLVTAYLFGSYAKGKQTDDSDIDLALIIDHLNDTEKFDVQVQLMLMASELNHTHYRLRNFIQIIHLLLKLKGQA